MDYDRLKETTRLSYRLTELTLEIDKLVAHVPTPMSPECFAATLLAVRLFAGNQTGVDYLEGVRAELQERVDNGIAAANPERFRVMWSAFTPFWDTSLQAFVQQKYGAVSVCEVLSGWRGDAKWYIDPEDPLACLAYRDHSHRQLPVRALPSTGPRRSLAAWPGPQVQGGRGDLQQQLGLQAGGRPRSACQGRAAETHRCADGHAQRGCARPHLHQPGGDREPVGQLFR